VEKVKFVDLDRGLEQARSNMRAAEAHGVLCGLLSGGGAISHKDWLNLLLEEWSKHDVLMKDLIRDLSILHVLTLQELNDTELKFYLFLPEDNAPIAERVKELSNWCQGFLFGFGINVKDETLKQHEQIVDAIKDIQEIGQVNVESDDDADESDFIEVTEYIRMAILMIYDTLQPVKASGIKLQ
jgi:yecA family protein